MLAVAVVVLLAWWSHVPNGKVLGPRPPNIESVRLTFENAANLLRLVGIVLLPVVVLARPRRVLRQAFAYDGTVARWLIGLGSGLLVLGYLLASAHPFVGNYLDPHGVLANDIIPGSRPRIMPAPAFDVLVLLGTLSAVVLVAAAVPFTTDLIRAVRTRTLGQQDPLVTTLGLSLAGFAVAYELATFLRMGFSERTAVFDRYALPMFPLVGILFLFSVRGRRPAPVDDEPPSPGARAVLAVVLIGVTLVGFAYSAESASFDGTRWDLANAVVARGYSPLQVHAGYEWEGWFRGKGPLTAATIDERQTLRAAYFQGMCVTITIGLRNLPKRTIAIAKSTAPTRKPATIVAARNARSCAIPPGLGSLGEKPIRSQPLAGRP